ncbi:MAG: multidrug ABC transporter substrate-binding protein [Deltaproteobacteria bacterium RBG_13_65_10]|jgi:putative ABC transport system permease protein|nr:MAG: multidrug ABC transporter substrate-binding protein [Deltaproteobacteria bacterium RBG_13_65_10]
MNLWQTTRVALRALRRNKLRSFLTTLGVIIGVGAVIAMVAIGEGAKVQVEKTFAAMGSNLLIILPGTTTAGGARGGFGTMPTLTWDDLKAIREEVPSVRFAAPSTRTVAQVLSEDQNWTTQVTGTTPEYFHIRDWTVGRGLIFTDSDVEAGTKVVLLGQTVVEKLYGPDADPVGQTVRIRKIPFQVIGVLAAKGQSPMGTDYDDGVFIPVSTFTAKIEGGLKNYLSGVIMVGARSQGETARAQAEIASLLRDRHHVQPGADDDFSIRNLTEMANAQQQGTRTLTTLLASVAAVSLLVGGIGIMNIMLVSVSERTREIGLRMAVGAKPRAILLQFLAEALALSALGGLVGMGAGLLAAERMAAAFGWPMLIRPGIIGLAIGFSALVGVGFGLYPARKASLLDPIEALRYE